MSDLKPVDISKGAHFSLTQRMREWSGWRDASLVFGTPVVSPWADTNDETHTFTANADVLVLNPNRVIRTLTPFRLRQEAILTGALIHEAGHARYSRWLPETPEALAAWRHSDGSVVTNGTLAFARLFEEPRVEGHMSANAKDVGITGLDWTLRATVAYLMPMTDLSVHHGKQMMQLIQSWALRAGRAFAVGHWTGRPAPQWANDFTSLVHDAIYNHLLNIRGVDEDALLFGDATDDKGANNDTHGIINILRAMYICDDHTGTTMIDLAKRALDMLFPETPEDERPTPDAGCDGAPGDAAEDSTSEAGDDGEGDESGEGGEGNTEPEDEGSGDDPGAGDSGDDDADPSDEGSEQGESDEQDSDGDQEGDESDSPADNSGDEGSDADDGASPSTDEADDHPGMTDEEANAYEDLKAALADVEAAANREAATEQAEQSSAQPSAQETEAFGASDGPSKSDNTGGWRRPDLDEREMQKAAEKFLRDMISPTETSKVSLSQDPAPNVDGGALAAWRAAGARQDPKFFVRHRREVMPSPPVKVAVLVDVSASMSVLQKPSALLSWAIAAAAIDLRNFAGRGVQVESTLIHWGSTAEVIQRNGELLPGIRERDCRQGTTVMGDALRLVEEQIPGFFDADEQANRLLVQFTDWQLAPWCEAEVTPMLHEAMMNGVNMLSVLPYNNEADLRDIVNTLPLEARHRSMSITYKREQPSSVWDSAAKMLNR